MRSSWIKVDSSFDVQFDVGEQRIVGTCDLVLDQAAAARAEELAEHRPIVDVATPVADVRVGRRDIALFHVAVLLVVLAERTEVRGAARAGEAQAALFAPQLEVLRGARRHLAGERNGSRAPAAAPLALRGAQLARRLEIERARFADHHAVHFARAFARYGPVLDHVRAHPLGFALERIAVAAG